MAEETWGSLEKWRETPEKKECDHDQQQPGPVGDAVSWGGTV